MSTETYSVLGQAAPTGTTETTLLTVGAAQQVVASTLAICNITANTCHADVNVRPGGAAVANAHANLRNTAIDPYTTLFVTIGLTLAATDVVSVRSDTGNGLAFSLYGTVIS